MVKRGLFHRLKNGTLWINSAPAGCRCVSTQLNSWGHPRSRHIHEYWGRWGFPGQLRGSPPDSRWGSCWRGLDESGGEETPALRLDETEAPVWPSSLPLAGICCNPGKQIEAIYYILYAAKLFFAMVETFSFTTRTLSQNVTNAPDCRNETRD